MTDKRIVIDEIDFENGGMKQTVLTGKDYSAAKKRLASRDRNAFAATARRQARQILPRCLSKAAAIRGDTQNIIHFDIVIQDGRYSHTERYSLLQVQSAPMPFAGREEQTLNAGWRYGRRERSIPADFTECVSIG